MTSTPLVKPALSAGRGRYQDWSDARLVRESVKSNDSLPFSVLVERYKESVFRLAVSVLWPTSSAEAEEVAQDVFFKVHQNLGRFRHDSQFGTWLYRITYNTALDHRRKPQFRLESSDFSGLAQQPSETASPLDRIAEIEKREFMVSCINKLADPYRSVVFLHYWFDCSVQEIADYFEVKPSTVKSHLFRARKRLAEILRQRSKL